MSLEREDGALDPSLGVSELDTPKDRLESSRSNQGKEVELRQLDEDLAHGNWPHSVVLLPSWDQEGGEKEVSERSRRGTRANVLEQEGQVRQGVRVLC
jgi:hypothetical protein